MYHFRFKKYAFLEALVNMLQDMGGNAFIYYLMVIKVIKDWFTINFPNFFENDCVCIL